MNHTRPLSLSQQWLTRTLPGMWLYTEVFIAINVAVVLFTSIDRICQQRLMGAANRSSSDDLRRAASARIYKADLRLLRLPTFTTANFVILNLMDALCNNLQLVGRDGGVLESSLNLMDALCNNLHLVGRDGGVLESSSIWFKTVSIIFFAVGCLLFMLVILTLSIRLQRKALMLFVTWFYNKKDRAPMQDYVLIIRYITGTINVLVEVAATVGAMAWAPATARGIKPTFLLRAFVLLCAMSCMFVCTNLSGTFFHHTNRTTGEISDEDLTTCPENMRSILAMFRKRGSDLGVVQEKNKKDILTQMMAEFGF